MIPIEWAPAAMQWFVQRIGKSYDLWGNIHPIIGFVADSADKYFCSLSMSRGEWSRTRFITL